MDTRTESGRNGTLVEIIEWGGSLWRRYPNSPRRHLRVYYAGYQNGKLTSLHRAVWESVHGPIPAGCEIHHIDQNPLNNAATNLECLTVGEHRRKEASLGTFSSPKQLDHLQRIRGKAADWHRSEEGRAWHAENARRAMRKRVRVVKSCQVCGGEFRTIHTNAKFCSPKCCDKIRGPRTPTHQLICQFCNAAFMSSRKAQQCCSTSCRGKLMHVRRRGKSPV